ncbi:MAG TPA: glycosyltransferase family 4 protein [Chitinophagaceae bacterium]|nr:glycosyltransferase family 4 protein [Chitinophagaceae bacterium]
MKHILYLPSWFPTRRNPYPGDFIKRHAESASLFNRITIFYTAIDETIKEPELVEERINENLFVYIYYYPSLKGILSPVINGVKRFSALRKMYNKIFADSSPDLVHVHVAFPAGLFALYLKKRKGLEYIISEHDGIYMPGYDNYHVPGQFEKKMVPVIYSNAKKIHAVSKSLSDALLDIKLTDTKPIVIPNVVNTDVFKYHEKERGNKFGFIHISSLINQKNPEGMLQALSLVKKERNDFVLKILGPAKDKFKKMVKDLSLEKEVIFMGEIPYADVAKQINNSDAMVHFTRYETFGCVIAESLCCGVPIIVSDLDVTRELVTDGISGLLVAESNVQDLVQKILYFMKNRFQINSKQVAEDNQQKFNYQRIGKMFDDMYNSVTS